MQKEPNGASELRLMEATHRGPTGGHFPSPLGLYGFNPTYLSGLVCLIVSSGLFRRFFFVFFNKLKCVEISCYVCSVQKGECPVVGTLITK